MSVGEHRVGSGLVARPSRGAQRVQSALDLARLHRSVPVGHEVRLALPRQTDLARLVEGGGFDVVDVERPERGRAGPVVRAVRLRTLPDYVAPDLAVLVCGLNPSVYSADAGVGFARPGNRFWPAAVAAGLVPTPLDPLAALAAGVGMTDLVKRATPRADVLTRTDYEHGLDRLRWLVSWSRPSVLCFVGLAGWRAVVDGRASPGVQQAQDAIPDTTVYLMPSTSGANASSTVASLTAHLTVVRDLGRVGQQCQNEATGRRRR
jgi:TDG/mug DNA glycosylase family protein